MNSSCNIIFPHQLFKDFILPKNNTTYLIEEYLFFNQYKFHKQKILFHRGTMKYYEKYLKDLEIDVVYINSVDKNSDIRILISEIIKNKFQKIEYIDTVDYLLEKRRKIGFILGAILVIIPFITMPFMADSKGEASFCFIHIIFLY